MDELESTDNDHSGVQSADESDNGNLNLIYTDNNGSFTSRRSLELFKGRNRQFGNAVCPECKQSFVNAGRLERHLAVHQIFGAYLCPLCGKTYKYEYNLFFHWRRTCQYLNELIKVEQRKDMDVNSLRVLVEEIVLKRNQTESFTVGISQKALFNGNSTSKLEMPIDPQSPLARACSICGILVHKNHHAHHEALHLATAETGLRLLDLESPTGGYFCDLCGVAFRNRDNLYAHWRSGCVEIMANIEPGSELFMSDLELKEMVLNLLWRLRRVSRKTPLRAIRAKRECVEEVEPLIRLGTDGGEDSGRESNSSNRRAENAKIIVPSSGDPEGKALIFMDDYVNPGDTVVDINGELVNVVSVDRGKWNISENGKPLECPDCFRQFANAGRLERHISGFHSHYGAFKCLLCGHRFKYDYNLLFHYRHSCAYTKLLVGADVRKLLDAASLRKLVSHIKQSGPQLRLGNSRLINIQRRPALKAVPRNIRTVDTSMINSKIKRRLVEGKKCPVCGVMFYGQKSLDRHIGTVHLLNHNFLDKAITRVSTSPKLGCGAGEAEVDYAPFLQDSKLSSEQDSAEEEAPPLLEAESPGEVPPITTRCVDINGEEIHDFDAEQLSELDMMLHEGQLSLGDLVITSSYGEDIEYRIAVGTRHGSQIVLERNKPSVAVQSTEATRINPLVEDVSDDIQASVSSPQKKLPDNDLPKGRTCQIQEESRNNEDVLEYVGTRGLPQYVHQGDAEVQYDSEHLEQYVVDDPEGQDRGTIVRFDEGQDFLEYLDDEECCNGFVQYVREDSGNQVIEFIENGTDMVQYLVTGDLNDSEVVALLNSQTPSNAESQTCSSNVKIVETLKSAGNDYT